MMLLELVLQGKMFIDSAVDRARALRIETRVSFAVLLSCYITYLLRHHITSTRCQRPWVQVCGDS